MSARPSTRFVAVAFVVLLATAAALGQTMAEKYPPNEDELRPTMGWAPQFQREITAPERDRVHLNVDWADNELDECPVTFGVPFPDGALSSVDHARLVTGDGTVVPAQIDALGTWWRKDGPVRWALVNATVRKGEEYFIEYGTAVRSEEPEGMEVQDTDETIVINTGALRVTISKQRATLLDACALDLNGDGQFAEDEMIVTPQLAADNLPVVVDAEGNRYPAAGADEGLKVEIVEQGPMRTAIRREGWYVGDDGTRFCQFITYTYFYAGQAGMKHDHTLVVAFDSKQHQIRDVELAVPLKLEGEDRRATFGQDERPEIDPIQGDDSQVLRLVQDAHDDWVLTVGEMEIAIGEHAGGWFGLRDERWGAAAGIRDFWEQYPCELEVADGALRMHLWPAHGTDVLNFQPSAWMGDEYPAERVFWRDFYRGGLDSWVQAYGVGKTHSTCVQFFGQDWIRAARLTRAFDNPVLVLADPEWNCATEAFGRLRPEDREHFLELEGIIDALIYRKQWLRQRLGNYGWISFGDVNYNLENSTDPENITYGHWRHWASMFYGGPNVMPLLYLRSGRREAWDFHRSNTKHITDIDICHLDSEEFQKRKGGRYGGNGGICHYAADIYPLGCDCHLRFMLYDYYLNGNLRTWEVANEFMAQYLVRRDLHQRYAHRMTGGGLRFFSEAYEATWNPDYLSCMRQFADILYGAQKELGFTRYDDVYMNVGKIRYYQLTGDERMRDLFLNDMTVLTQRRDANVFADCRHTTLLGLAHAYWFTGDRKFLPYALWQLEVARSRVPTSGEPHQIGATPWAFEHPYNSTLGNQLPVFMALLAQTKDLPLAVGPSSRGNWAIYFHEPEDREFKVKVEVEVYPAVPGLSARPRRNWEQWLARLPGDERPQLVMLAPDGSEIGRVDLLGDVEQEAALSADKGDTRGGVAFTVPADGQTGTYAVVPTTAVAPVTLQVVESTLPGRVMPTGDNWTHATTQHFRVPAGTGEFSVAVKAIELRSQPQVTIRNETGEEVASARWEVGSECRHDWEVLELNAGRPAEDEVWSVNLVEPVALFLRFEGVPGFVAASPGDLFVPGRAADLPAVEQVADGDAVGYVDSSVPGAAKAAALPAGVGVKISSPDAERPLLDETEGTIEMWVKDTRQYTDLRNCTLIRCGGLHLYRRICVGTYLYIGGAGHQTGFVLPQGRWCHLAATWRPSPKGGTEVAIYADGVRIETTHNRHINPDAGWAGPELIVPASHAGLFVDELRVSDIARYDGNFEVPAAPFEPDEHTRVLCHFDGDGQAWVLGATVPLAQP